MDLDYIQMLLEFLKQKKFQPIKRMEHYQLEKVGYYDWHRAIEGQDTDLRHGIGGVDTHYQVGFTIDTAGLYQIGRPLCLTVTTSDEDMWDTSNPQFIVSVNGHVIRALDMNHNYVLLPEETQHMEVSLNVYTNTLKEDVFIEVDLSYRNDAIYHLYYQVKALLEATLVSERERQFSFKVQGILSRIIETVDLTTQDLDTLTQQAQTALDLLEEWYQTLDQDEDAVIEHVVGHTHIDISWFWTLKQTREKVVRSFSNAVYLMDRYPEMTFMSSSPLLYRMLEEEEPALFERVRAFVQEGRWETEGSMFVESDSNLPNGESLIRQIMFGKKYFKQTFNKDNHVLWLPDCFGFSASLPQIMKKSGIDYFFTSKMEWNENNRIPNDTFYWKGIDGSEVLAHLLTTSDYSEDSSVGTTYNGRLNASQTKGTWTRYKNKKLTNKVIQLYGFGDGGGGPTEEMLEYSEVFKHGVPNMPIVQHSTPLEFFRDIALDLEDKQVPRWSGELYLETHRGVLTTDGRLKKLNRETETLLQQAEYLETLLVIQKRPLPELDLNRAWEQVLINQFHDILPGSSSKDVHKEAVDRYQQAQEICRDYIMQALKRLGWQEQQDSSHYLAVNTTSFERDILIDHKGKDYLIEYVSAYGFKKVDLSKLNNQDEAVLSQWSNDSYTLENDHYIVSFNTIGEISRLYAKALQRDIVAEGATMNQMVLYPDLPKEFDAWNIDAHSLNHPKLVETEAQIKLVKNTPLRTVVEVIRDINQSQMTQRITFYKHSARIDFETDVDWCEKHVLLKAKFPTRIKVGKAMYDIQFGNYERPTHLNTSWDQARFEVSAQKWADLSEQSFGLAILNNGKYGHAIQEETLYLSLLRGSQYPAPEVDKGLHQFTYSLYPHQGTFRESDVYKEAYDLNYPAIIQAVTDKENVEESLLTINSNNIICETVKRAENQPESIVLRFYESEGKSTKVSIDLKIAYKSWQDTNLLEEALSDSQLTPINLSFNPYEIKTILVAL